MAGEQNIEQATQLLVEGNDQRNFFEACNRDLGLSNIQVQDFGGVKDLRAFLSQFVKAPSFGRVTSIGIVRDAEASEPRAFQSVQSSLANVGLPVPDRIGIRAVGAPSVSVLVLPGDGQPGMLETLGCDSLSWPHLGAQ